MSVQDVELTAERGRDFLDCRTMRRYIRPRICIAMRDGAQTASIHFAMFVLKV